MIRLTVSVAIAGLDPVIHAVTAAALGTVPEWMPGSSPGMTNVSGSGQGASGTTA